MKRSTGRGQTMRRGAAGFDEAVLGTCFSGVDPGVRPRVLVQANDAQDVIAAVQLAREEGLRISICSGGHSWMQNHLRADGLLIDLSRLRDVTVDAAGMRAVAGPGVWAIDLDRAVKAHGLFFPVAHALDVGLGGFLLQGGFGWNSRAVGLGCENVVGIDAVLADGRLVHASAQENPDLFWAARGAGPGFFAVVVRYHLRLHPRPKFIGMATQVFRLQHLEAVFSWADRVGPDVSRMVEFQILLTRKAMGIGGPGLEVIAPVLAPSWREAREAVAFLTRSEIRPLASLALPLLPISTTMMTRFATQKLFPPRMRWGVDNMWTDAPIEQLLPGLRRIAETMPPPPSHALWLNWQPPGGRPDMAFSMEANRYLALYTEWKQPSDDGRYMHWATENMRAMAPMAKGIQLADENLARRPARFVSDENLIRLDQVRGVYDPHGLFHSWRGRPDQAVQAA